MATLKIQMPECQGEAGWHLKIGEVHPRPHMRQLQFGRAQVPIEFPAQAGELNPKLFLGFAAFTRLQPQFLHFEQE